jgi:cholest-4-en-3-one 26-monooxygenase
MSAVPLEDVNIVHPDHYVAEGYPHDVWTWLRREDPVHWFDRTEGVPFWAITKHADIVHISKRPHEFPSGPRLVLSHQPDRERPNIFPTTIIGMDPPKHGIFRQLVNRRFTPNALKRLYPDIDRIGREIVEGLVGEGSSGECDFVEKVAAPLPIAVIAWMLGVPESDWRLLFDWTNRTIGAGDPEYQAEGDNAAETARAATFELFEYFRSLVEEKRKNPADDLITLFSQLEYEGVPLTPEEVLAWCFVIVLAGNETTRNATTGGMLAFIEHPDELRKFQRNPDLLKPAVEEVVRWTSPIIHFSRTATVDCELRGKQIRTGDVVGLFYASANRDEEIFDHPFEFRIDRDPNRHLGFGMGEHFCLGAHVARTELQIAYKHLLPRIESVELAGPVERLRSNLVGGIKHLPIRYKLKPAASV